MQLAAGVTQVDKSAEKPVIVLEQRNRVSTREQLFLYEFLSTVLSAPFTNMLE